MRSRLAFNCTLGGLCDVLMISLNRLREATERVGHELAARSKLSTNLPVSSWGAKDLDNA